MRRAPTRSAIVRRRILAVAAAAAVGLLVAWPALHQEIRKLTLPLEHADIIRLQAQKKSVDPALIAAVIYAETKFNPRPSSAGAEGLMQILPATAKFLAHLSGATTFTTADLGKPAVNIAYGSYYLRYLLDRYNHSETLALAAYNGGAGNVDGWLTRAHQQGQDFTVASIPFPETRAYVTKVEQAQRDYRANYAAELGLSPAS
ncbi:MAG: lytic transglycosylase domain-containing protein [Solirubrobacteraceae bacterium]